MWKRRQSRPDSGTCSPSASKDLTKLLRPATLGDGKDKVIAGQSPANPATR